MSIERQHGKICVICDECDDSLEFFDATEFEAMLADARSHNWRIVNTDGAWRHYCGCQKRDRVAEARRRLGVC